MEPGAQFPADGQPRQEQTVVVGRTCKLAVEQDRGKLPIDERVPSPGQSHGGKAALMVGRLKVAAEITDRLDEGFRSVVGLVTFPIPFDEQLVPKPPQPLHLLRRFGKERGCQCLTTAGTGAAGGGTWPIGKASVTSAIVPAGRFSTLISRRTLRRAETGVPPTAKL